MSRESAVPEWQPDLEPYVRPAKPPAEIVEFPVVEVSRDTASIPRPRRAPARLGLSPALAGMVGAAVAVGLGLLLVAVPVAILWVFITGDGLAEGLRAGVLMWLGAQSVPVTIAGVGVSLLPWGFGLLMLVVVAGVARWSSKIAGLSAIHRRQVMGLCVVAAIVYSGIAAGLAAVATSGAVLPARAAATGCAVLVVWWLSAAGRAGVRRQAWESIPAHVRAGLRTGVNGFILFGAAAVIALVASLAVHRSEFVSMVTAPGDAVSIAAMALLMLGYLPVALSWSAAYLLGPGFTVSEGVVISPLTHSTTDVTLPAMPWLAGVPTGGGVATLLLVAPVGLLTGAILMRRIRSTQRWQTRATAVAVAAVTAGVCVGIALTLSSGSVGVDRLAFIGPNSITSALIAAGVVAIGASLVEAARLVRRRFRED